MQPGVLLPSACGGVVSNPLAAHIKSVVQLSKNCSALTFSDLRILKHYDNNVESIYTACVKFSRHLKHHDLSMNSPQKVTVLEFPPMVLSTACQCDVQPHDNKGVIPIHGHSYVGVPQYIAFG